MCIFSRAITYGRRRVGTSPLWVRGSRLSGEHVWESAHAPCHVTSSPKASSPWTARGYPTKDQGRIDAEAPLILTAHQDTRFVLIDVPSCRGWGYDQAIFQGARG